MEAIFPIERAHRDQLRAMGGFWYLASPYTNYPDGHEVACKLVCKAAEALMKRGARIFCPIAHCHTVASLTDLDPSDQEFWLDQDAPMLRAAHGLFGGGSMLKPPR